MSDSTASHKAQPERDTRPVPCLVVLQGCEAGRVYPVTAKSLLLGAGPRVDIRLEDRGVSRRHARLRSSSGAMRIEDLNSTNGCWVNGRRIRRQATLKDGDKLQLGACRLTLRFQHPDEELAMRRLYARATRDSLTGLLNRASLKERLDREIQRHLRYGRGLGLIQFDLDRFKAVNDRFGHAAGDRVLKAVAGAVRTRLRRSDQCGRLGGEEFLILAPESDLGCSRALAEKIRLCIEGLRLTVGAERIPISASFGVAAADGEATLNSKKLLVAVDAACYAAKGAGRNQVVCA